ncbi:response regulator [Rariglobus hedericola]|nr:response regulator [Rariglobus hedericola]
MSHILLVDDHVELLAVQQELLENAGHTVVTAVNGFKALAAVAVESFDLVITDIIMPRKEGIETIMELKKLQPHLKIIAMSGGGRMDARDHLEMAGKLGADYTLRKPFNEQQLSQAINIVLASPGAPPASS